LIDITLLLPLSVKYLIMVFVDTMSIRLMIFRITDVMPNGDSPNVVLPNLTASRQIDSVQTVVGEMTLGESSLED